MKKLWKVLGIAAAVAALAPYKVEKDDETGATNIRALLWGARYTPATEQTGRDIDVTLGLHAPRLRKDEAELYADDDPDAAVLEAEELQILSEEAREGTDEAQYTAGETQAVTDEAAVAPDDDDDDTDSVF